MKVGPPPRPPAHHGSDQLCPGRFASRSHTVAKTKSTRAAAADIPFTARGPPETASRACSTWTVFAYTDGLRTRWWKTRNRVPTATGEKDSHAAAGYNRTRHRTRLLCKSSYKHQQKKTLRLLHKHVHTCVQSGLPARAGALDHALKRLDPAAVLVPVFPCQNLHDRRGLVVVSLLQRPS